MTTLLARTAASNEGGGRATKGATMKVLATVSAVTCLASLSLAQSSLPDDVIAGFWKGHDYSGTMYLPAGAPDAQIEAKFSFFNDGENPHVRIDWLFWESGADPGLDVTKYDTPYLPTAMCKRTGLGTVMYVAGWSEHARSVIIEKWDFESYALAAAAAQGGGGFPSTLTVPPPRKTVIFTSGRDEMQPLHGIACNPFSNTLLLLERSVPRDILMLDIDSGQVDVLATEAEFPELGGHRRLDFGMHPSGGLLVISQARTKWDSGKWIQPPVMVIAYQDSDLDGEFESIAEMTHQSFYAAWPGPFDTKYTE